MHSKKKSDSLWAQPNFAAEPALFSLPVPSYQPLILSNSLYLGTQWSCLAGNLVRLLSLSFVFSMTIFPVQPSSRSFSGAPVLPLNPHSI